MREGRPLNRFESGHPKLMSATHAVKSTDQTLGPAGQHLIGAERGGNTEDVFAFLIERMIPVEEDSLMQYAEWNSPPN